MKPEPYYDEGDVQIYCGDCLEVMPHLPKVDLVLTDTPYGTTACEWDSIIPLEPMWKELKRLIKLNSAIVMTASQPFTTTLIYSNMKMFKCEWIWKKDKPSNFALCNIQPLKYHENICVFGKGKIKYIPQKWAGIKPVNKSAKYGRTKSELTGDGLINNRQAGGNIDRFPMSIINIYTAKERYHPTQKPVKLMKYLIRTYTNQSDLILDFAMGSGTTLVAAKELGRKAIGIEIEQKYCDIAIQRLKPRSVPVSGTLRGRGMIVSRNLRKIVEKSGMREITLSMVIEAERESHRAYMAYQEQLRGLPRDYITPIMAQQVSPRYWRYGYYGQQSLYGTLLGGHHICPCCGR